MHSQRLIPTYRDIHPNSFHVHFINEKHERFVPIRIQVTRFNAGLLFLSNSFSLKVTEKEICTLYDMYATLCKEKSKSYVSK